MAGESGVLVLAEHKGGELLGISTELLGAARRVADALGQKVTSVSFGSGASAAAKQAVTFGADTALAADNSALDEYRNDTWTAALVSVAKEVNPAALLIGQTTVGRDLAPRAAIRLGSAPAMDCIDLQVEGGKLLMTRPAFGGNANATYSSKTTPQVATIRAKSQEPLEANASRAGEVKSIDVDTGASKAKVVGREEVKSEGIRLEDAKVVVSGGRGLGGPEGFQPLQDLAGVLGGAVGATRAVVDLGWVPVAMQVGLTGKVVTPDLYVAVGISGASQHLAGITGVKSVVGINKDKDADIFKVSRFGVVADWKPFMTAFLEECRRLKA